MSEPNIRQDGVGDQELETGVHVETTDHTPGIKIKLTLEEP